ncbi:F-box only protein 31 [Platysternon megacephalum]|uniref:F-box only protein 31 n=1 Tax=Platysternon megacephalum TaxID=55544 RepID=A0A4D9EE02_9SAUR|nr:F-box only protein 31 [Platysternon megacephalum]
MPVGWWAGSVLPRAHPRQSLYDPDVPLWLVAWYSIRTHSRVPSPCPRRDGQSLGSSPWAPICRPTWKPVGLFGAGDKAWIGIKLLCVGEAGNDSLTPPDCANFSLSVQMSVCWERRVHDRLIIGAWMQLT